MKHASPRASFLACCLLPLLLQSSPAAARTLLRVTVVYRHGDRSPTEFFPTDPNKNAWPQGPGQLTKLGMQQQYELGQYIKQRYKNFLNASYDPAEVYVRSTDYDRTLMSAEANFAGMYPPTGEQIWNPSLAWQPIPVHTVPMSEDQLLGHAFENCPPYKDLIKDTIKSEQFKNLKKPFKSFIQYAANVSGYAEEQMVGEGKIWKLYDTLLCEQIHRLTLPNWATREVMSKLKELSQIIVLALFDIIDEEEKLQLQVGLLLDTLLKNYTDFNNSNQPKIIIYSAHETTISALHMALGVSNKPHPLLPPYAACHFFELYKEDNGTLSIDMYYRNDSSIAPHTLVVPGCGKPCYLDTFRQLLSPYIADDQMSKCDTKHSISFIAFIATLVLLILSIVTIIGLVFYICRLKGRNNDQAY